MATKRTEDYLEAIARLSGKRKGSVKVRDLAGELGVGMPSVTEMLQKLAESGYISYEKYRGAALTAKGRRIADETLRKHEMLKRFLISAGVSEPAADEDACKMEHILSEETLGRLAELAARRKGAARSRRLA